MLYIKPGILLLLCSQWMIHQVLSVNPNENNSNGLRKGRSLQQKEEDVDEKDNKVNKDEERSDSGPDEQPQGKDVDVEEPSGNAIAVKERPPAIYKVKKQDLPKFNKVQRDAGWHEPCMIVDDCMYCQYCPWYYWWVIGDYHDCKDELQVYKCSNQHKQSEKSSSLDFP